MRAEGIDVGMVEACGWSVRNCLSWFLDRRSAEVFSTPGMCDTVICISNMAVRNHRHRRRCMAIISYEEPFLIASTALRLSHLNSSVYRLK